MYASFDVSYSELVVKEVKGKQSHSLSMRGEVLVTTCARVFRRREKNDAGGVVFGVIYNVGYNRANEGPLTPAVSR